MSIQLLDVESVKSIMNDHKLVMSFLIHSFQLICFLKKKKQLTCYYRNFVVCVVVIVNKNLILGITLRPFLTRLKKLHTHVHYHESYILTREHNYTVHFDRIIPLYDCENRRAWHSLAVLFPLLLYRLFQQVDIFYTALSSCLVSASPFKFPINIS